MVRPWKVSETQQERQTSSKHHFSGENSLLNFRGCKSPMKMGPHSTGNGRKIREVTGVITQPYRVTGWWQFKYFFEIFIPIFGNDPIWLFNIFQMVWCNHQLGYVHPYFPNWFWAHFKGYDQPSGSFTATRLLGNQSNQLVDQSWYLSLTKSQPNERYPKESWDLKTDGLEIPDPCYTTSNPLYSGVQWFLG